METEERQSREMVGISMKKRDDKGVMSRIA